MRTVYEHLFYQRPYDPDKDVPLNVDHAAAVDAALRAGKQVDVASRNRVFVDGLYYARLKEPED
jgi:hypothetical protein